MVGLDDRLDEILGLMNAKGWNAYVARPNQTLLDIIPTGPAEKLEIGTGYLLLPSVADPDMYVDVVNRISVNSSHNIHPIVQSDAGHANLYPFRCNNEGICAGVMTKVFIPYEIVGTVLDTLPQSYAGPEGIDY